MSNRVIKFRVWDESRKVYLRASSSPFVRESETGGHQLVWSLDSDPWRGPYTIEQFTGLHDKNGKEIYEGDILKSENVGYAPTAVVVYVDYEARFASCEMDDYLMGMRDGDLFNQSGEPWMLCACQIIGNIHENPELLKP